jgi:uncharacterized Zn finger protein (UPF0148 family)
MTDINSEIAEWVAIAKGDKCPLCKGTGKIRDGHVTCPRCGGKNVAKADASADEPNYGKVISGRKGEPTDQDLYDTVVVEAKKKFDVYPSAYANGWVVQEYKRRGGTYHKPVAKDANESLATILRHDEDHDNWHKMHGDAPCTSEADCAEKRAKYAEVKAEVAKSADEILAEIEQWRIQKGDVAGHEFHGNQYTQNARSSVAIVRELTDKMKQGENLNYHKGDHQALADAHDYLASWHHSQEDAARDRGDRDAVLAHRNAASEHAYASGVASRAEQNADAWDRTSGSSDRSFDAEARMDDAPRTSETDALVLPASDKALAATQYALLQDQSLYSTRP